MYFHKDTDEATALSVLDNGHICSQCSTITINLSVLDFIDYNIYWEVRSEDSFETQDKWREFTATLDMTYNRIDYLHYNQAYNRVINFDQIEGQCGTLTVEFYVTDDAGNVWTEEDGFGTYFDQSHDLVSGIQTFRLSNENLDFIPL